MDTAAVPSTPVREPPVLQGREVVLRPLEAADGDRLRAIASTEEVVAWWGPPAAGFPASDEPDAVRFGIWEKGELVGLVQYGEEPEPDYRHASIDVFVDPARRGRGLGTDAVATLLHYLTSELDHHRVTIDPAVDNAAAVRSYEKAGFRAVGVLRSAWRDPGGVWRDVLLMEHVRV